MKTKLFPQIEAVKMQANLCICAVWLESLPLLYIVKVWPRQLGSKGV